MDLAFRNDLNTELDQRLTLTPEMIQSLNVLQYSSGELVDYVYEMMMENPVIELETPDYVQAVPDGDDYGYKDEDYADGMDDYYADGSPAEREWDSEDWYNYAESMGYDDDSYYGRSAYISENSDRYDYEASFSVTLEESLLNQVEMTDAPYMIRAIAVYIIQTLDDNGYMTSSVGDIAEELGVSDSRVMKALELVWTFDPPGVGARNLAECLELQLKAIDSYTEEFGMILRDHLENIAMNRLSAVSKATGIPVMKVQDYADMLRSLEPKPGRTYASHEMADYVVPDVTVEMSGGDIQVTVNSSSSPKVIIRNEYRSMLKNSDKDSGVAVFLSGRFNSAMWLIKSIEQRNETISRVSRAIAEKQREFFEKGRSALKPLTMKEIAEELGIHESTVSRAVNGKYMQSPQGVHELRYFFSGSSRFTSSTGELTSSESLKVMIRSLVDAEDCMTPLSDRSIAEAIMVTGVEISRRTVAKYREELGIPSSSVRRRVKA